MFVSTPSKKKWHWFETLLENQTICRVHGGFLERVYESELDTKTEYGGF